MNGLNKNGENQDNLTAKQANLYV